MKYLLETDAHFVQRLHEVNFVIENDTKVQMNFYTDIDKHHSHTVVVCCENFERKRGNIKVYKMKSLLTPVKPDAENKSCFFLAGVHNVGAEEAAAEWAPLTPQLTCQVYHLEQLCEDYHTNQLSRRFNAPGLWCDLTRQPLSSIFCQKIYWLQQNVPHYSHSENHHTRNNAPFTMKASCPETCVTQCFAPFLSWKGC